MKCDIVPKGQAEDEPAANLVRVQILGSLSAEVWYEHPQVLLQYFLWRQVLIRVQVFLWLQVSPIFIFSNNLVKSPNLCATLKLNLIELFAEM